MSIDEIGQLNVLPDNMIASRASQRLEKSLENAERAMPKSLAAALIADLSLFRGLPGTATPEAALEWLVAAVRSRPEDADLRNLLALARLMQCCEQPTPATPEARLARLTQIGAARRDLEAATKLAPNAEYILENQNVLLALFEAENADIETLRQELLAANGGQPSEAEESKRVIAALNFAAARLPVAGSEKIGEPQSPARETLGIIAGSMGGTYFDMAADLSSMLSEQNNLRVFPMVGKGSFKDLEDLLHLKGLDVAIVQQDVIDFMESDKKTKYIRSSVRLLAPLSSKSIYVLASESIQDIYNLAGRKVNFGPTDSGTFLTSKVVFEELGIDVEFTNYPHGVALEKLRNGEIEALIHASSEQESVVKKIEPDEPFHLLSVPIEPLAGIYSPQMLTTSEFPALIEPDEPVTTVAVANALVTYNSPRDHPRGQTVASFAKRFFDQQLEDGFHDKWRNIDVTAQLPGWQRHWAAEDALRIRSEL